MVLIWSGLAQGDGEYCAILVCVNSILQVCIYTRLTLPYPLTSLDDIILSLCPFDDKSTRRWWLYHQGRLF
jgi:ACR3 family arsenite efflux pump ArsB